MTTNLQSLTVVDSNETCSLTVTCLFAVGTLVNGCRVIIREYSNDTTNSSDPILQIFIPLDKGSLLSEYNITSYQYQLVFDIDVLYVAEGVGIINEDRADNNDIIVEFEIEFPYTNSCGKL